MPGTDQAPTQVILRLGDGAVLAVEQLPDGQIQCTRIEPDGSAPLEVLPRLQ